MEKSISNQLSAVSYLTDPPEYSGKEYIYIQMRSLEGRIYSDDEVKQLPQVSGNHHFRDEWKIRAATFIKLRKRLSEKKTALDILDIGCGNGWMSNRLAEINDCHVTGVDLNQFELEQSARVFGTKKNLQFIYGNVTDGIFSSQSFDIIVLAASIQYFPDLKKLLNHLLPLLKPSGEIHIIDSQLYSENKVVAAKNRSIDYYSKLGVPQMINYYFHHRWNDIVDFNYSVMNRSFFDLIFRRVLRDKSLLFPWIMIRKA